MLYWLNLESDDVSVIWGTVQQYLTHLLSKDVATTGAEPVMHYGKGKTDVMGCVITRAHAMHARRQSLPCF